MLGEPTAMEHEGKQLIGEKGEHGGEAMFLQVLSLSRKRCTHRLEQAAAGREGEDRGIEQRLDDVTLAARHILQPVVLFDLFEEELDLPA